ncbi:heteromeric transposase endonuclease subunit TnsA, partial [Kamptonema sp. UHCC 0994]|uniref:heteromeric transposase endonuclease subunit TnsA n=1 Tax=Kamptonema sp. UHCC 0994 TaxID=3031329 RepID=UPI0023B89504
MLSKTEFNAWCSRFNPSQQTQILIEKIRSSEPSRRVGGGTKNVSGRYPSRKMGVTIQFESHKVELPFIYELEHDEDVLEFYDQPPQIKLDYEAKNGRKLGVLHTPDFFVIRTNSVGWEECKTEQELKRLTEKNRNRYFCSDDNQWLSPPGQVYAQQFGLYYRIRSDNQINWILQRNLIFLEDYFRANSITLEESVTNSILSTVLTEPGITLAKLLHQETGVRADDIYTLIATEQLYVNLNTTPLAEPERCLVFSDQQTSLAYQLMVKQSTPKIAI